MGIKSWPTTFEGEAWEERTGADIDRCEEITCLCEQLHLGLQAVIVSACFFILPQDQTYSVFRVSEEEDIKLQQTNDGKTKKKNDLKWKMQPRK